MNSFLWFNFIQFLFIINFGELKNLEYKVGGLFSERIHQVAFELIARELNNENSDTSFDISIEPFNVSYFNSLEAQIDVCTLFDSGVIGIFGPSSIYTSNHIQSICDQKEIPQIEIHYDTKITRNKCVINLHPHHYEIISFFNHLILRFEWNRFIVLFEDNESLLRLEPLLELNMEYNVELIFRQLDKDASGSYREILNNIKKMPEKNILLDCSIDILQDVLVQAQQVGLMTDDYSYIIMNLDFSIINLESFQYGGTNITGARVFNPEDEKTSKFHQSILEQLQDEQSLKMKLSTALLIDGMYLFHKVIQNLASAHEDILNSDVNCHSINSWNYGYTVANQIKSLVYENGITGRITFDVEGFRRDFKLDILELTENGLDKIGEWNSTAKSLNFVRAPDDDFQNDLTHQNIFNTTFKVITCLTAPYAMLKETTDMLVGNDRFEGFCIDVIHELSLLLGFNYTFLIQEDGANGNLNRATNEWNGVIREIIDGRADFAITDLTITSERENAVDFTMPFMNLGISILYRKPEPVPPSLFMFTSPFSTRVWIMLGVAYILVSIAIFIMGRLSPSEWTNPFPCIDEPEYLINQFSIRNSLWFTIGGLLQQGSELAPISISTRTASGFWWFFVLIMVSSYTANLAAFLTVETLVTPFKNIDELAKQTEIAYGAKSQGATQNFFRDSNVSSHKKVWQYLKTHPDVMTNDNDDGVLRVETKNYAYFMESTTIEYVVQRHCSLAQVGGLLDDKGYGIAIKKYSPYRNDLSTAILKLQETGKLTQLKIKWWKEKRGGSTCGVKSEGGEAAALGLKNVGGVFLVLFIGALLALIGSFLEMAVGVYRKCKLSKLSFKEEIKKEISFIIRFKANVKEITN